MARIKKSCKEFIQFHGWNFVRISHFIIGSEPFRKNVQITCCFPLSVKVFQWIHMAELSALPSVMLVNTDFRKFMKWRVINLRTWTERHVITFRKQLINLLYQPAWAILVKLSEINMIPLIILNKTQSFITG